MSGGVVEHHVGHDLHAGRVALADHGFELVFRTETRVEFVADRLVDGPPLRALDGFLRRGDLHVFHAFRTIGFRAFVANRLP